MLEEEDERGPVPGFVAGGAVEDEQAIQAVAAPGHLAREALEARHRVFPGHRDQVARARQFVRAALGPVPVVDEVVLLVSELCTNALLHTASGDGGAFEVAVYLHSLSLHVEVRDGGAGQPAAITQPADTFAEAGRGLGLVELLADQWGHCGDQHGRSVFFELRWKQPD